MKELAFVVTISVADKISSDNEILEMAENIAQAIKHEIEHGNGIVPEDSETFTTGIEVKPWFQNESVTVKF